MDPPVSKAGAAPGGVIPQRTKEEEIAENIRQALDLAGKLHELVQDRAFREEFGDRERYNILCKKYPTFAQAYPVCLRMIAMNVKYSERAFRRFLEKQRDDPGKGMSGYIERQADYARFLYEEDCRTRRRHINYETAKRIWDEEYKALKHWVTTIEEQESKSKNEYEEEHAKHLAQRRRELLDYMEQVAPTDGSTNNDLTPEQLEEIRVLEASMPEDTNENKPTTATSSAPPAEEPLVETVATMKMPETVEGIQTDLNWLRAYEDRLLIDLERLNERIHVLEEEEEIRLRYMGPDPEIDPSEVAPPENDWLSGTAADPRVKSSSVSTANHINVGGGRRRGGKRR
jgi:hypothetical protein